MMNREEYCDQLETLVGTYLTKQWSEYFYWDILPQLDDKLRLAWSLATGEELKEYED